MFSTAMTPPPPRPSTPSQPPPSSSYPSTTPPASSPAPSTPTGLPYTRRAADSVSETVQSSVSAADEGASCPTILSQVEHTYTLPHPLWKPEQVVRVHPVHRTTESTLDTLAYYAIRTIRFNFDLLSGWVIGIPNVQKVLTRVIFLESIAGVPGSVAGLLRHLASLRRMKRDYGWIHTLHEEAENERTPHRDTHTTATAEAAATLCTVSAHCYLTSYAVVCGVSGMHLLTFLQMKQPGPMFRGMVWLSQGIFTNFFFLAYVVSPKFCHRVTSQAHT